MKKINIIIALLVIPFLMAFTHLNEELIDMFIVEQTFGDGDYFIKGNDEYDYGNGEVVIPSTFTKDGEEIKVVGISPEGFKLSSFSEVTKVTIESGIKDIGYYAFAPVNLYNGKINEINLPDTVVTIQNDAFRSSAITQLEIPGSVKYLNGFSGSSDLSNLILNDGIEIIGEGAFTRSNSLSEISIPNSVKVISDEAFSSTDKITKLVLNEGLEFIGSSAFEKIEMDKLVIPSTVREISRNAFNDIRSLNEIEFKESHNKLVIHELAFNVETTFVNNGTLKVSIPNNTAPTILNSNSFYTYHFDEGWVFADITFSVPTEAKGYESSEWRTDYFKFDYTFELQ